MMVAKNKQQKIVIVGGGMVGISLALLLEKTFAHTDAVTISLIERFAFPNSQQQVLQPSFDDRSTALNSGSIKILNQINCWQSIGRYSESIRTIEVSDRGHFGGAQLNASDHSVDALGYVIENRFLGQTLLRELQQSQVHCLMPATVRSCRPKKGAYDLVIENDGKEETITTDLLIIADGAESQLRTSLGIETEQTDYSQTAVTANVILEKPHQNIAYERFTDEGPIALLPLPDIDNRHRAALVWTIPTEQEVFIKNQSEQKLLALLKKRFGYRAGQILNMGKQDFYPLKLVRAREQIRSHLVIMGNAAHFLHPVAGQGFNLALRDCRVLSECVGESLSAKKSIGDYSCLKDYVAKQERDQQLTITLTDQVAKLFSTPHYAMTLLRQLGLLGINNVAPLKNTFAQQMMGL
jgi:2-polyprenyl-6-methoxyphenol 4-hydroxylase